MGWTTNLNWLAGFLSINNFVPNNCWVAKCQVSHAGLLWLMDSASREMTSPRWKGCFQHKVQVEYGDIDTFHSGSLIGNLNLWLNRIPIKPKQRGALLFVSLNTSKRIVVNIRPITASQPVWNDSAQLIGHLVKACLRRLDEGTDLIFVNAIEMSLGFRV